MRRPNACNLILTILCISTGIACSGTDSSTPPATDGGSSNGGVGGMSTGGAVAGGTTGGTAVGGARTGGAPSRRSSSHRRHHCRWGSKTGGAPSTGGSVATGGATTAAGGARTGGAPSTGGSVASGGSRATGGSLSTGGAATGGTKATGGAATGGTKATGGAAMGGAATGGTKATGGATATGGAGVGGGTGTCGNAKSILFNCRFAWGMNRINPTTFNYVQFISNWAGYNIRADGTFSSCDQCGWLKNTMANATQVPVLDRLLHRLLRARQWSASTATSARRITAQSNQRHGRIASRSGQRRLSVRPA